MLLLLLLVMMVMVRGKVAFTEAMLLMRTLRLTLFRMIDTSGGDIAIWCRYTGSVTMKDGRCKAFVCRSRVHDTSQATPDDDCVCNDVQM